MSISTVTMACAILPGCHFVTKAFINVAFDAPCHDLDGKTSFGVMWWLAFVRDQYFA
jgi:hypothetical protein